jgi:phospholipid/cholesterol/gamma-HCH transport system permease protein
VKDPGFTLEVTNAKDAAEVVHVRGQLKFAEGPSLWDQTTKVLLAQATSSPSRVDFDLSEVTAVDGGAMALLVHLRNRLEAQGVHSEFVGAGRHVQEIVHLYEGDIHLPPRSKRRAESALSQIGRATLATLIEAKLVLAFFGQMLLSGIGTLRSPRTGNWKDLTPTMERAGADAVPIVALINFLVGFVMAFQGAVQLKPFGADIFVADLVGLSVTRELGPLMTAIIVCGRSGAAFAAELGSMKVSEEIDALRTMGFGPMGFLVLPRVLALVLVLPLLTLLADFVGALGGLVVGLVSLHLSVAGYITETVKAVHVWDVYSGVIKSVAFAIAIGLVACQQGLATTGGAEGVGRRTTASVVTILFSLILLDAAFTIFFHAFNL